MPADNAPDPEALCRDIANARTGSAEALNRLWTACRGYLLRIANEELDPDRQCRKAPSDVVQESLLEANHAFDHFRGDNWMQLLSWLRTILRRNIIDAQRTPRREQPLYGSDAALRENLPDEGPSPSEHLAALEDAEAVRQALERLPSDYQRVIQMRNCDSLSFPEIGQTLGKSADAVMQVWRRALKRLKEELGGSDAPK